MIKTAAIILSFLLLFQHTNAADKNIPVTRFGFVILNGGLIVVRAQLDSIADTLNFVLDTGSGGISLDSATADEFHIPTVKTSINVIGIAGSRLLSYAYNHSLKLNGFRIDNLQFHLSDYDILTCANGIKIDGIIGYSVFKRYIVSVNYDKSIIELYDTAGFMYPPKGYYLYPLISPLLHHDVIISDALTVNTNLIFDTGAGLFCLLNNKCVKENGILNKKRKKYAILAEGVGGKKHAALTVVKKIKLGKYSFRNVPTYLIDDEYNVTGYPIGCGLIGNEILRRFNTILDYPHNTIFLKPNSHYFDLFDYSYTGLSIYNIDDKATVAEVMPSSPGENAGFLPDDIIVTIDNVVISNIQQCKALLQNTDKPLIVWVLRNEKSKLLTLEVKNIQN